MHRFDKNQALTDIYSEPSGDKFFNEGRRGLAFLNNNKNYPWMLKDPRLCITVRTWLPLLEYTPAIVFQYRHPLEVALSLQKREAEHFKVCVCIDIDNDDDNNINNNNTHHEYTNNYYHYNYHYHCHYTDIKIFEDVVHL